MKTIGMIGGLAWPSTIDYYRGICAKTNEHYQAKGATAPYPTPHIIIESVNVSEMRLLRGREGDEASWERYDAAFHDLFLKLQRAGADIGVIASNTPHMRLSSIIRGLGLPVVSILDATAEAVRTASGRRVLILGTPVTMRSSVYANTFRSFGIETLPPLDEERIAQLEQLIDVDLYQGQSARAREWILEVCRGAVTERSDVVCLACTELPVAFPEHQEAPCFEVDGMTFVNTTAVHIQAILRDVLD